MQVTFEGTGGTACELEGTDKILIILTTSIVLIVFTAVMSTIAMTIVNGLSSLFGLCIPIKKKGFKKCKLDPRAHPLKIETDGSACFDIAVILEEDYTLEPGKKHMFETGWGFIVPRGFTLKVHDKSGIWLKNEIQIHRGVVDSDFRKSVKLVIRNTGTEPIVIQNEEYVAQIMIVQYEDPNIFEEIKEKEYLKYPTQRGGRGFSSDIKSD